MAMHGRHVAGTFIVVVGLIVARPGVAVRKTTAKKASAPTTTVVDAAAPKSFCEAWANVRNVRTSGLTGISALRLQSERYQVLVALSPAPVKADVAVMADYFATTLALADKPLNNAKLALRLEALIPKIGDALTAVTRHAVRTCPRSLVLPPSSTTSTPSLRSTTTTTTKRRI